MEVSRRTDYAIRIIAALIEAEGTPLSVRQVASDYQVPYSFARSIQHELVKAGILKTIRGAKGGMLLNMDSQDITLYTVVDAIQGGTFVSCCTREENWCPREKICVFHKVWQGAERLLADYLSSVTIEELLKGEGAPAVSESFTRPNLKEIAIRE